VDITNLDRRLEILKWEKHGDLLNKIADVGNKECVNEFREWTPLKLIGLSYFAGGYATILSSLREKNSDLKVVYIDLFSGCGINKIEDILFVGSPLATIDSVSNRRLSNPKIEFDMMFFNDLNDNYFNALTKRLNMLETNEYFLWIKNKYTISNKDCNDLLDEIVNYLNSHSKINYLAFIDPYKWAISWKKLESLISIGYGDIMITLQAKLIAKEIGKYDSLNEETQNKIKDFLGIIDDEEIRLLNTEAGVKDHYINKLSKYMGFIKDIEIKGGDSNPFKYYLIFATHKGAPKWQDYIESMKGFVETYSGDLVKDCIDHMKRKQMRISDF
jgi:three-Cys-motif partner protein